MVNRQVCEEDSSPAYAAVRERSARWKNIGKCHVNAVVVSPQKKFIAGERRLPARPRMPSESVYEKVRETGSACRRSPRPRARSSNIGVVASGSQV